MCAANELPLDLQVVMPQQSPVADVMTIKGTKTASRNLFAAPALSLSVGSAVYVMGVRHGDPGGQAAISSDKGMLASSTSQAYVTTAHADAGWSGGPAVSKHGKHGLCAGR